MIGFAWWAKVETINPRVTYWFGPFLTKRGLNSNLNKFLQDLSLEGTESIEHKLIRGRRGEPLTI